MFSFQNTNFISRNSNKQRHNFDVINFLIITKNFLASFWRKEAYRSHPPEFILYFLTISGLLLWDNFDLSWSLQRITLTMHILVSLVLFPLFVLPFWLAHRNVFSKSPKVFLRKTGRLIEFGLIALTLSGLYLFLLGNRGEFLGQIAYWTHFLFTFPLLFLVIRHALRWSIIKNVKWIIIFCLALLTLIGSSFAATESTSLITGDDGSKLFSANYDAGSVSWIDKTTGERIGEINVGGDLRRIAMGQNNTIAVTDYSGGRLVLINWRTAKVIKSFDLGPRPFGVVYDKSNNVFWVTLFEAHELVAVHPEKGIVHTAKTRDTPRGLALLSDNRLIVTHSLIGEVSIYDAQSIPPVHLNTIRLHKSQEQNEFLSQGVPRVLDDIAVSPDETEAWLPHVLWNFDHLFQFQSTIFPAISLLDLRPGHEQELIERRKHLFQQINLKSPTQKRFDGSPKTLIMSNPHDAAFSNDGSKVFITMAASEDLLVFNLLGRDPIDKTDTEINDAKASEIVRHLPGTNPRALVVDNTSIFIQNAMSLDITLLKEDRAGPVVQKAVFARTVSKDPLEPSLRRGKTLFHSANTDRYPNAPMSGDFWMSCQSCHVDGFNFTNGYLFDDTPIDKYRYARIGHGNLSNMIAGNFIGDYLRIIQDTQGGMGHDGEGVAELIDPDAPSDEVVEMMLDLHEYISSRENLPFVSSWLRLDNENQSVHESEWVNSATCASCHTEMFDQWADSLHRLMGESNSYYMVMEDVAAATEGENFRQWCMGCHSPQGLLSGQTATMGPGHMFEQGGSSLFEALERDEPDLDEGTGCLFCHRISSVENSMNSSAGGNASLTVNLSDRKTYVFENNTNNTLSFLGNHAINAKPSTHANSYSQSFYADSKLCSSCHNEFAPGSGSIIVNTFGEWEKSSFNRPDNPEEHRSCIDCHMHGDIQRIGQDIPGTSTDGGRVKPNVVTHQFTGANYHLVGLRNSKLEQMSIELLQTAANLKTDLTEDGKLSIRIKNIGAGHALPTGVADFRQIWLDLSVYSADGRVILESGKVDDKGFVDPNARFFRKVFGDKYGNPVGLRFWRYEKMLEDTKIPADGFRDEVFDLPDDIQFPIQANVKLMFRTYPQFVTNLVREQYPALPNPKTVLMTEESVVLNKLNYKNQK
ncbi:YncE family protein [Kiloniella litopenaei]|uniref:YncE family protein n=1 Tax=Kiloniella litopenaei TaxID=1549748 RepID=UPI003BAA3996